MRYAISDIHGDFDGFIKLIEKVSPNRNDVVYILGDVIDRGDKSFEVLDFIMKNDNFVFIRGNHEEILLDYALIDTVEYKILFERTITRNGGTKTYRQYEDLPRSKKIEYIDFLKNSPVYMIDNEFILVHAGLDISVGGKNINEIMNNQYLRELLWSREQFYTQPAGISNYKIVFGHTPTILLNKFSKKSNEKFSIWNDQYKIGIDCGNYIEGGQLGCLRLDDLREYYYKQEK